MSKKRVMPLIVLCALGLAGVAAMGCQGEAHIGTTEPPKTPPPPPPPAPPPPPPPAPVEAPKPALKAMGKAKIVGNQIQVPGKIHFALDKATIDESKQETKDVLDSILKTLQE